MSRQEGKVFIGGLSWETTGGHRPYIVHYACLIERIQNSGLGRAGAIPLPSSPSLPSRHADEKLKRYFENYGTVQVSFFSFF